MDIRSVWEDAPAVRWAVANALQDRCRATPAGPLPGPPPQFGVPSGQDRPGWPNPRRLRRHRGGGLRINAKRVEVLDEDWEAACFVEKCPGCFAAVAARTYYPWWRGAGLHLVEASQTFSAA